MDSEPLARAGVGANADAPLLSIRDDEYAGLIGLPFPRVHAYFAERIAGLEEPGAFWTVYSGPCSS